MCLCVSYCNAVSDVDNVPVCVCVSATVKQRVVLIMCQCVSVCQLLGGVEQTLQASNGRDVFIVESYHQ